MQPDTRSALVAQRLLLLTYSIAAMIRDSDELEIQAMLDQREEALRELSQLPLSAEAIETLEKAKLAEQKIFDAIQAQKAEYAGQLHTMFLEQRGHAAYRRAEAA